MRMLAAALCIFLSAQAGAQSLEDVRQKITSMIPNVTVGEIREIEGTGILEVQVNGREIIYTDRQGIVAIHGTMIDLKTRTNLTEKRKQDFMWVDFASLPLNQAITRVKGDGSRKLAVFTDPDCPYCKRLESELAQIDNATIYIFLFPLPALHPDASRKARLVWCAEDRAKAWDGLMLQGVEPAAVGQDCADPIGSIADTARRLGIQGTPGLVFQSGRLVPGLINRDKLEEYLAEPGRS